MKANEFIHFALTAIWVQSAAEVTWGEQDIAAYRVLFICMFHQPVRKLYVQIFVYVIHELSLNVQFGIDSISSETTRRCVLYTLVCRKLKWSPYVRLQPCWQPSQDEKNLTNKGSAGGGGWGRGRRWDIWERRAKPLSSPQIKSRVVFLSGC